MIRTTLINISCNSCSHEEHYAEEELQERLEADGWGKNAQGEDICKWCILYGNTIKKLKSGGYEKIFFDNSKYSKIPDGILSIGHLERKISSKLGINVKLFVWTERKTGDNIKVIKVKDEFFTKNKGG